MLKTAHCPVRDGAENPVDLRPFAGIPREVTELELRLHAFDRLPLAPLFDLNDKSRPGDGTDDAISRQSSARLKRLHRGFSVWTELAVDNDALPMRPRQILQRLYRVCVCADRDIWSRADLLRHDCPPGHG